MHTVTEDNIMKQYYVRLRRQRTFVHNMQFNIKLYVYSNKYCFLNMTFVNNKSTNISCVKFSTSMFMTYNIDAFHIEHMM